MDPVQLTVTLAGVGVALWSARQSIKASRSAQRLAKDLDEQRDRRAVIDRFLTATTSGHTIALRIVGDGSRHYSRSAPSSTEIKERNRAEMRTALGELRSAGFAVAARYPSTNPLLVHSNEAVTEFEQVLARLDAMPANQMASFQWVDMEETAKKFTRAANRFFSEARSSLGVVEPEPAADTETEADTETNADTATETDAHADADADADADAETAIPLQDDPSDAAVDKQAS